MTALVKDGNDSDVAPDEEAISATLVLTPMVKGGTPLQYTDAGRTKLKVLTSIECEISALGDIVNGPLDYVTVPAPDSSNTNMSALQWQATFKDAKYGTKPVSINPIFFWAVSGGDIDLADEVNTAPSSTAVQITRGPRGFGLASVETEESSGVLELVSYAGPADDPDAWLEVGRTELPAGQVSNSVVAPLVEASGPTRAAVDQRVQTVGDTRYAPLWAPSTAYTAGQVVTANGISISRIANGTS
ncbi:hypothetical protein CH300_00005, partial [Rhodococcus sp. 15-1154-1]